MSNSTGYRVLDREYLEARAAILQLAAIFDRLERSDAVEVADPRLEKLRAALSCLSEMGSEAGSRAEEVQLVFSRPYQSGWRQELGV